jgi:hypothetical protein
MELREHPFSEGFFNRLEVGKDGVAMSNVFDYFTVEMLCKLYSALSAA